MFVFIFRGNTTLRTLHIYLSSATCFAIWPSSGRLHNNIYGKIYWGGGLPFTVHSFFGMQNATISCCSHELLPFLSVIYPFLPPFSTNQSSILHYFILPPISLFPNSFTVESRSIVSTSIVFLHVLFAIFGPELSSI